MPLKLKIRKGDKVGMLMQNRLEFPVALLGTLWALGLLIRGFWD